MPFIFRVRQSALFGLIDPEDGGVTLDGYQIVANTSSNKMQEMY
jgi:hypothetical protein